MTNGYLIAFLCGIGAVISFAAAVALIATLPPKAEVKDRAQQRLDGPVWTDVSGEAGKLPGKAPGELPGDIAAAFEPSPESGSAATRPRSFGRRRGDTIPLLTLFARDDDNRAERGAPAFAAPGEALDLEAVTGGGGKVTVDATVLVDRWAPDRTVRVPDNKLG